MKKGLEMLTVGFSAGWLNNSLVKVEPTKGPSQVPIFYQPIPSLPLFKSYDAQKEELGLPKIKLGIEFDFYKHKRNEQLFEIKLSDYGSLKIKSLTEEFEIYSFKKNWQLGPF